MLNYSSKSSPEFDNPYCPKCGQPGIKQCPSCQAPLRGRYHVVGFIDTRPSPERGPAFCRGCGEPFPWTNDAIASATVLAEELDMLSEEERVMLARTIEDIVRESPRTAALACRPSSSHCVSTVTRRRTQRHSRGSCAAGAAQPARRSSMPRPPPSTSMRLGRPAQRTVPVRRPPRARSQPMPLGRLLRRAGVGFWRPGLLQRAAVSAIRFRASTQRQCIDCSPLCARGG